MSDGDLIERLEVRTDHPDEGEAQIAQGWFLRDLVVLRFYESKQADLIDRKLYLLRFWRPKPKLEQAKLL